MQDVIHRAGIGNLEKATLEALQSPPKALELFQSSVLTTTRCIISKIDVKNNGLLIPFIIVLVLVLVLVVVEV